jgi:hypothetical protein
MPLILPETVSLADVTPSIKGHRLAQRQRHHRIDVVVGHFWRAKYGHFSRVPKCDLANNALRAATVYCDI